MISLSRLVMVGLAVVCAVAGCGRDTYLARLDETRRYFAYEDRLNQFLTPVAWAGRNFQLRVPNQFHPITAKAKPAADERDPRQPVFAEELELPGLQGAWQATFKLTGNEGEGQGWLYLCSNFDLSAKKDDELRAASFNSDVIHRVATAVGQQQQVPSLEKMQTYEVPPKGEEAFVDKRKYKMLNPGIPTNFKDKPYRVRIYSYKKDKSPAQICLIYVLPDNIVQASTLDRAIDMSLETLVVTQDRPTPARGKRGKGGKGPAPASSKSI